MNSLATMAGALPTVGSLFRARARIRKIRPRHRVRGTAGRYGELLDRVHRATAMLAGADLAAAIVSPCCRATGPNISRSNWRRPIWASSPPA